jgi:hypothetical protein
MRISGNLVHFCNGDIGCPDIKPGYAPVLAADGNRADAQSYQSADQDDDLTSFLDEM